MTVAENLELYANAPLAIVKLWEPGFGSLGGWIGALLISAWYLKKHSINIGNTFDEIVIPTGMLGHGFGRLACFGEGDVYGKISLGSFYVLYTNTTSSIPDIFLGIPLHPLPLYMSISLLGLFVLSLILNKKSLPDGQVAAIVLFLYTLIRFLLEFLRSLYDPLPHFMGLNSPQIVCLFIASGSVYYIFKIQAGSLEKQKRLKSIS